MKKCVLLTPNLFCKPKQNVRGGWDEDFCVSQLGGVGVYEDTMAAHCEGSAPWKLLFHGLQTQDPCVRRPTALFISGWYGWGYICRAFPCSSHDNSGNFASRSTFRGRYLVQLCRVRSSGPGSNRSWGSGLKLGLACSIKAVTIYITLQPTAPRHQLPPARMHFPRGKYCNSEQCRAQDGRERMSACEYQLEKKVDAAACE